MWILRAEREAGWLSRTSAIEQQGSLLQLGLPVVGENATPDFVPRPKWRTASVLPAASPHHTHRGSQTNTELLGEPRLAEPGSSAHEHDLALATTREFSRAKQCAEFGLAPYERSLRPPQSGSRARSRRARLEP